MDFERLFSITDNLRVLVRETGVKTYVAVESGRDHIFFDVEKWKKFELYFPIINTEFNVRFEDDAHLLGQERLFTILENLRALVREFEEKTYVGLESDKASISLNSEKWKRFKKYFPIICTEFKLRYES